MEFVKKKKWELDKCYSIAPLEYQQSQHILVAAEKINKCLLFDTYGNYQETIWEGPGGTMSMVQVPSTDGHFLATQKFYSPNDSADAQIVLAKPDAGGWSVRTVANLPFVHRFDILQRGGVSYVIACTLKSAHAFKDDWSSPGKVYVAQLPCDLDACDQEHPLDFQVIQEGLLKNHGYCRVREEGGDVSYVAAENGVFRIIPPDGTRDPWKIEQLLDTPASDVAVVDLDGDGQEELVVITPFHGDTIEIYKNTGSRYEKVYTYEERLPFAHAIWAGDIHGTPGVIVGHREGERSILVFTFHGAYEAQVLERQGGAANIFCYERGETFCMVAANREINEVGFYELREVRK